MDNVVLAINWWAVLTATVTTFALGALWYGPLFGKPWTRLTGMTQERIRESSMGRVFGLAFLLQLVAATVLAWFMGPATEPDLVRGLYAGAAVGLGWVTTALGVVYLFERRPLGLWLVDAGYQVAAFVIMGAILGVWR